MMRPRARGWLSVLRHRDRASRVRIRRNLRRSSLIYGRIRGLAQTGGHSRSPACPLVAAAAPTIARTRKRFARPHRATSSPRVRVVRHRKVVRFRPASDTTDLDAKTHATISCRVSRVRVKTDEELLKAWRAGDSAAGATLFERHYATVYRFFCNKVPEPRDFIQLTFVGCLESVGGFRQDAAFRTFLVGIAINVLRNHYRQQGRGARGMDVLERSFTSDLGHSPSAVIEARDQDRLLLAGLRRLPVESQVLVELRFWEGLKVTELAELLDRPLGTIKTRIRRAMELLRQHITELATSPQGLSSTLTTLDQWAEQVRSA